MLTKGPEIVTSWFASLLKTTQTKSAKDKSKPIMLLLSAPAAFKVNGRLHRSIRGQKENQGNRAGSLKPCTNPTIQSGLAKMH